MKATVFFRMIVLAAMAVIGITNAELKAQEENFVTNEIKDGDLVTSKVIYRMDGSLYRHMKYDFSYDNQKRMTAKDPLRVRQRKTGSCQFCLQVRIFQRYKRC